MRIILGIVLFLFISFWLMFIISVGVSAGIKTFQKETEQRKMKINFQKKEEKENESI